MPMLNNINNIYNRVVIGTDNACEWYIGYFTKFGNGAADILRLVNLKKSHVFELGKYLDVPKNILGKAASVGYGKDKLMKMKWE